jgi:AraC-like DNA-binding protein
VKAGWGERKAQVLAYIKENPDASVSRIANDTGASRFYVMALFDREGVAYDRRMPVNYEDLRAAMRRQPHLIAWLKKSCPAEIDMGAHIVSILLDGMHDAEDRNG